MRGGCVFCLVVGIQLNVYFQTRPLPLVFTNGPVWIYTFSIELSNGYLIFQVMGNEMKMYEIWVINNERVA